VQAFDIQAGWVRMARLCPPFIFGSRCFLTDLVTNLLAATPYHEYALLFQSARSKGKLSAKLVDQYRGQEYSMALTFTKSAVLPRAIVQEIQFSRNAPALSHRSLLTG
jgi:hypothetical protein